jgi:hypothetical protein
MHPSVRITLQDGWAGDAPQGTEIPVCKLKANQKKVG